MLAAETRRVNGLPENAVQNNAGMN